jgi:hypothetical protein
MPKLSVVDSPAQPDLALVHWIHIAVGTQMYILNSRPDLTHSVHQVARFVHNPGSAHVKALDHILRYFAGTGDLCLIVGNWTPVDRRFLVGFHVNAYSSHKNVELDFRGITGIGMFAFGTLLLSRSFVQDQVSASSCEAEYYAYSSAVKDLEYVRLLLRDLRLFLMTLLLLPCLLIVSRLLPCLRAPRIVLVQSILTLQWLRRVITFNAGGLLWNIVLQLNRLLICGPSS